MLWWIPFAVVVLLAMVGALYQAISSAVQLRRCPPPGRLVDVGGRRLYLHVTGAGPGPTVVLVSGRMTPAVLWHLVQSEVSGFARVVSYDRAGYGWSDPAPAPRSGDQVVQELHTLLHTAGIPGPYLLVGHSLGGVYTRLFASRYPDEVAGMVLVDAFEENIRRTYGPAMQRLDRNAQPVMLLMSWLGLMRAAFSRNPAMLTGGRSWLQRFPAALHPAIFGLMYHPRMIRASNQEWAAIGELEEQLRHAGGLGDLPLAVLIAGLLDQAAGPGLSAQDWAAVHQANREARERLTGLSTRSHQQVIEQSGHMIPLEQPAAVAAAIQNLALETPAENG